MKKLPLDGVRIADLSMMWAGPYCTRILGEMGAEIIKIESPRAWDNFRTLVPQPGEPEPWNTSYYWNYYNAEKKSLTLDLAQDAGRDAFLKLVAECDVVIENYRADVMGNLRLDYDVLSAVNPEIIMVSMAGFGKTGPEALHVGFGPIIEQMSGLVSLSGFPDDNVPTKTGISYGDPIGGLGGAAAVILALIKKKRTGKGGFVDLAQRELASTLVGERFVAASLRGEEPALRGNRHPRYVPQGAYPARGVEQWIVLSVATDEQWQRLCGVIRRPEWASLTKAERADLHDEIDGAIAAWSTLQEPQVAMENLQRLGVPAGRVLDTRDIHEDPQLNSRGFWQYLPHPKMHPWRQPAVHWRLIEANPTYRKYAPSFGEHNREILGGLLGYSDSEIDAFYASGVCSDAPVIPA